MHQLFTGPDSADERVVELDSADDRAQVRHLALAAAASLTITAHASRGRT